MVWGHLGTYLLCLYRHECFTGKYTVRKIHTKLHPGPEWRIFHILTSEDIVGIISRFCTVVCAISRKTLVSNIIKRKLHGGLKIWILFSRGKNNILLTREALVRKILFLPLENKIHIFASPCNILYVSYWLVFLLLLFLLVHPCSVLELILMCSCVLVFVIVLIFMEWRATNCNFCGLYVFN